MLLGYRGFHSSLFSSSSLALFPPRLPAPTRRTPLSTQAGHRLCPEYCSRRNIALNKRRVHQTNVFLRFGPGIVAVMSTLTLYYRRFVETPPIARQRLRIRLGVRQMAFYCANVPLMCPSDVADVKISRDAANRTGYRKYLISILQLAIRYHVFPTSFRLSFC